MKKLVFLISLLLVLTAAATAARKPTATNSGRSRVVELCDYSTPGAAVAATTGSTTVNVNGDIVHPTGTKVHLKNRGIFVLKTKGAYASTDYFSPAANNVWLTTAFQYTSNPSEGGIVNFLDNTGALKAAFHLTAANKLVFYDSTGTLQATGTTVLANGTVYTLQLMVGVNVPKTTSGPWKAYINGVAEISGNNNVGNSVNGSVLLGGGNSYTGTYNFDNVYVGSPVPLSLDSINSNGTLNFVDFETGDLSQAATQTNAQIVTSPPAGFGGNFFLTLTRNNSVANYEIRAAPFDVFLQTSVDDGQTWQDWIRVAAYNGTVYVPFSAIASTSFPFITASPIVDDSLVTGINSAIQGPCGNRWRIRFNPRNTKGGFNFQALLHAN
jgi:hypothetical protein